MREIKFRGKREDNGDWVFGSFIPDALEGSNSDLISWGFIRRYNRGIGKMETIEVDRETVGQFTGLHDKNGKPIYEGDVVSFYTSFFGENKGYIVMNSGSWMIWDEDVEEFLSNVCARPDGAWCEVIGTIHDKAGDE